ncbi:MULTISPECIES: outer membrane beta-barrel protein [unclassified Myroides]|uniref:outer membrane beta-barrel protein n=1 Tax=unclassified Myroides TaxID=2642485 RepID=UPI003D2F6131
MKHIIFSLLVLTGLSMKAQDFKEDLKGKTSLSVKAGWLQSTLKGDDVKALTLDGKIDKRNNFFVGVSVDNSIGTYFGLKHELFYQNYGADFKRALDDHTFNATLEMHSLRLNPISPTVKIGGLQVYAGPYINMLLYSSITSVDEDGRTYKDHGIFGSTEDDQEDSKYLQKMDYGITAGIEYQFKFGLILGAQYTRGFASIFDNSNTFGVEENQGANDFKIYNENVGVYVGYRF